MTDITTVGRRTGHADVWEAVLVLVIFMCAYPLLMVWTAQPTPATAALTFADMLDEALKVGHSGECWEDEIEIHVWTGDGHGDPLCVAADGRIGNW